MKAQIILGIYGLAEGEQLPAQAIAAHLKSSMPRNFIPATTFSKGKAI
jgi:hypothetical protein